MAHARARALRTLQTSLRYSGQRVVPRASHPSRTQLLQRRWASEGGHAHEESSDIPWMAGAIIVTVPSCYFLWPDTSHAEHHGGHGDEEHADSEEGGEEGGVQKEEGGESESQEEAPKEESSEEQQETKDDLSSGEAKEEDKAADGKFEKEEEEKQDKDYTKDMAAEQRQTDQGSNDKTESGGKTQPTKAAGHGTSSLPPGGDDNQKPATPTAPSGRAGSKGDKSYTPDTESKTKESEDVGEGSGGGKDE